LINYVGEIPFLKCKAPFYTRVSFTRERTPRNAASLIEFRKSTSLKSATAYKTFKWGRRAAVIIRVPPLSFRPYRSLTTN
jgi:hypothetical protein